MMRPGTPKRAFTLPTTSTRIDGELDDEFRFHIEERIEQFVAAGMSRADAEQEVARRFGDYERHRAIAKHIDEDTLHRRRRADRLRDLAREVRLAARALRRSPGFTIIALATLALGIGATTGMFSVLDAVVLRPLPYREAEQLVTVLHPATVPGSGERTWGVSPGGYFQFAEKNQSFSSFGIYRSASSTVTNDDVAEVVQTATITSSVFSVLAARSVAGRLLSARDDSPGAPPVAVLSYEFAERRFGGTSDVVGRTLVTSDGSFEIIGVAEPELTLPMPGPFSSSADLNGFGVDVWLPMQLNPAGPFYNNHPNVGIGRLKPGATLARARADVGAIFSHFVETIPTAYGPAFIKKYNFRVNVDALQRTVLGPQLPRTMWMLFGAVLLVLGIATANVANLYLVRLDVRRRETAVRAALGADRTQIATHHLAETLLLCISAAAIGLILAAIGLRAMLAIAPTDIPRLAHVALDTRAAFAAVIVAIVLGVVLGVLPLLRRGIDIDALRFGSRGLSASKRQRAARNGLVIGQLAMALTLLTAAGLMLRSFAQLRQVTPGFDSHNVLTFELSLPYKEYEKRSSTIAFHRELQRVLGAIPGVTDVGSMDAVPLAGSGTFATGCSVVFRENQPYGPDEITPCVSTLSATPGVFDVLRMRVDGRVPTWGDVDGVTQAVVVTKALANRLWPGESAIGKGIGTNGPRSTSWYRVVGVARDIKAEALDAHSTEAVFLAATGLRGDDKDGALNDQSYLIRTNGVDPMSLMPAVRRAISAMNTRIPVVAPRTMDDVLRHSMARTTFLLALLGVSASTALLLSAVGLYGVISYIVAQRRTEIGIRIALGASVSNVIRLVMLQSARVSLIGVALGLVGSLITARAMRAMLFGVATTDAKVLLSVATLLLLTTVVASIVPARLAAHVDPSEAMRSG